MITDGMIKALKRRNGHYPKQVIDAAKAIYGDSWLKCLVTDRVNGFENYQKILKAKPQSSSDKKTLFNPFAKDDWSWKPKESDLPKKARLKSKKRKKSRISTVKEFSDNEFYKSNEWRGLRVKVLEKYKCKCMMCGRSPKDHNIVVHVDHIKPRSLYPELSLDFDNLQLLCEDCNIGKSNKYETDYRPK